MKTPYLLLLVAPFLATFAGCALLKRADPASNPAAAVRATEQQLAREQAALSPPRTGSRKPDCTRARAARDNVCALGKRVCLLVDGDRAIPDGAARCKRANLQCEQASTHVTGTCRAPSPPRTARR
jgi:hypothetical protein